MLTLKTVSILASRLGPVQGCPQHFFALGYVSKCPLSLFESLLERLL